MAINLFYFLVFPGLLFAAVTGGIPFMVRQENNCQGPVPKRASSFTAILRFL